MNSEGSKKIESYEKNMLRKRICFMPLKICIQYWR
jgi:hypothetical protein